MKLKTHRVRSVEGLTTDAIHLALEGDMTLNMARKDCSKKFENLKPGEKIQVAWFKAEDGRPYFRAVFCKDDILYPAQPGFNSISYPDPDHERKR